ncbi:MAG: L-ribulose-5-phosphate 3-epimerase [Alistipes sp.]
MFHGHLLGLYEKALPAQWSWEQRLTTARELGFDYLEISIDESDERMARLLWSREQRQKLYDLTIRCRMPIRSMCLSAHRRFPFGSADPSIQAKAHEIAERAVEFADDMGIRVIQLAGYDVYYEPSTDRSVAAFLEGMRFVAQLAERYQVMHAMEIMDTSFMNSITKHLWYEEQIRSPYYRVYPDLGNLTAWGNNIHKELHKGIASIVAIHLKETRPVTDTTPGEFRNVPLGTGTVDFAMAFRILRELNYTGPFLLEMWSGMTADDCAEISRSRAFLEEAYSLK